MMGELTDSEKLMLAREVAADQFNCGEDLTEFECQECGARGDVDGVSRSKTIRDAVKHGWDAAIEYVNAKLAEGIAHLDAPDES
jgi:hypothetical protein